MAKHHTDMTDDTMIASPMDGAPVDGAPTFPGPVIPLGPTGDQTEIAGTAGADTLKGGDGDFFVIGLGGNDKITVGNGTDTIFGGDGNDHITAGNGNDFIDGGTGNDTITVGTGNDTIVGGDGNNTLLIGDWVHGSGAQSIFLGDGDNRITDYGNGDVNLTLGAGDNSVSLGGGNDVIHVNDPNGVGNNYIQGGDGDDTIFGSNGNDQELEGQGGNDTIYGMGGDDRIVFTASAGFDQVGDGMDKVDGGAGNDLLEVYGSAHGENFTLFTVGNHASLMQDDGNVNSVDMVSVEHIDFSTAGEDGVKASGSDNINIFDMTGTDVKLITVDLAGPNLTSGDGKVDTVTIDNNGGAVTVSLDSKGELVITGLQEKIVISHFDANDIVNIEGISNATITVPLGQGPIIHVVGPESPVHHAADAMMAAQAEAANQHAHG